MARKKSVLEKFADSLRDIAKTATDAASEALKADRPVHTRSRRRTTDYLPLAGDGFVSDPLMMPPPVAPRRRRKSRTAAKSAPKKSAKTSARRKPAKTSRAVSRKTTRKTKAIAKRPTAKSRRR